MMLWWSKNKKILYSIVSAMALLPAMIAPSFAAKIYKPQPFTPHYMGYVVADEAQAQAIGNGILQRGGNAVDAAVATSLALSVTLPSRASLGGGGACLVWHPQMAQAQSFNFMTRPLIASDPNADRPAGVPMMARGLYMMHQRLGHVDFTELVRPAQKMAIEGVPVGSLLYMDLQTVHMGLFADGKARDLFSRADGQMLGHNDILFQKDLHGVLTHIVQTGVSSLYDGALSHAFVAQARDVGAGLTLADMRNNSFADIAPAMEIASGGMTASFLPPPEDGGLATSYAWLSGREATDIVFPWRMRLAFGGDGSLQQGKAFLAQFLQKPTQDGTMMPALPASTALVAVDRRGQAVSCGYSMNNLFGTGRIAGDTGIVLAASPTRRPQPLYPLVIMHEGKKNLLAVISASGQNKAADEAAYAMRQAQTGVEGNRRDIRGLGWADMVNCRHMKGAHAPCVHQMLSAP